MNFLKDLLNAGVSGLKHQHICHHIKHSLFDYLLEEYNADVNKGVEPDQTLLHKAMRIVNLYLQDKLDINVMYEFITTSLGLTKQQFTHMYYAIGEDQRVVDMLQTFERVVRIHPGDRHRFYSAITDDDISYMARFLERESNKAVVVKKNTHRYH